MNNLEWCEICDQDAADDVILVLWRGLPVCTDCLLAKARWDLEEARQAEQEACGAGANNEPDDDKKEERR